MRNDPWNTDRTDRGFFMSGDDRAEYYYQTDHAGFTIRIDYDAGRLTWTINRDQLRAYHARMHDPCYLASLLGWEQELNEDAKQHTLQTASEAIKEALGLDPDIHIRFVHEERPSLRPIALLPDRRMRPQQRRTLIQESLRQ